MSGRKIRQILVQKKHPDFWVLIRKQSPENCTEGDSSVCVSSVFFTQVCTFPRLKVYRWHKLSQQSRHFSTPPRGGSAGDGRGLPGLQLYAAVQQTGKESANNYKLTVFKPWFKKIKVTAITTCHPCFIFSKHDIESDLHVVVGEIPDLCSCFLLTGQLRHTQRAAEQNLSVFGLQCLSQSLHGSMGHDAGSDGLLCCHVVQRSSRAGHGFWTRFMQLLDKNLMTAGVIDGTGRHSGKARMKV